MKTIHMIGAAHLDPVWLWTWQEGFQENKATFLSALERMDEFDDFVFTSSSAQFYEWIEKNDPDLFEKIRQRVREGRWKIVGGWWVQPDVNIPSGESLARHALISQHYFEEKFGVRATTGYCVDSFGHNAMLPQILKKSGMDNYVYMRPNEIEKPDLPYHCFLWEAPDGSRVKTFRIRNGYGHEGEMEKYIRDFAEHVQDGTDRIMCFYGVGNHGGGPTIENLRQIEEVRQQTGDGSACGYQVIFSDPDTFFAGLCEQTLPVVRGELQYHSPGCYSAESMIKQKNRETENALTEAEAYTVLSGLLGPKADDSDLTHAWKDLLFNQFHDTQAGSAVSAAYEEARSQLGEALTMAHRCTTDALNKISFRIDIPKNSDRLPLLVFNPHSFSICEPVEFEFASDIGPVHLDPVHIVDARGQELASQYVQPSCRVQGRRRISFLARVPALGYALYYAEKAPERGKDHPDTTEDPSWLSTPSASGFPEQSQDPYTMENEHLKVTFSPVTGTIARLYDKDCGKEALSEACSACVIDDSTNDTWGHRLKKLDQVCGRFELMSARTLDAGPVRKAVQFVSRWGSSVLTQVFSLYTGEKKVRVRCEINWQEHLKALKLYFPVNVSDEAAACAEIPYGYVEKKKYGHEEPMQRWADLSDDNYGLAVLNDAKYACDFTGNRLGVTVLRSPVFAHHQPYELKEDEVYEYMDQGISRFGYEIVPHKGTWRSADIVRQAAVLNQKPATMFETFHEGPLPAVYCGMEVSRRNVVLSALKTPLRGTGTILRFYETEGRQTTVRITLGTHTLDTVFSPYEIKTFRLEEDGNFREENLLEEDI